MSIEVLLPDGGPPVPWPIFDSDQEVCDWRRSYSKIGWRGYHPSWPAKRALFSRLYVEIIEFLMDRREKTLDPMEYYLCLPYLSEDIGSAELDQTFEHFRGRTHSAKRKFIVIQRDPALSYGRFAASRPGFVRGVVHAN